MAYYNNYDPRGGYNQGGYPPRGGYGVPRGRQPFDPFHNPNIPFEIGQKVIHTATGLELSVIRFGREQVECRKPDLSSAWFYAYELEPIAPVVPK